MIVIVDERELVKGGFHSLFGREGIASAGFLPNEFDEWVGSAASTDLKAVSAVLLFRLVTFWLPTLPGYWAFNWLTKKGAL